MQKRVFGITILAAGLCFTAQAANISKANNTTALNLAGSWTGGAVPSNTDTAVYSGLTAGITNSLGIDQSWQGLFVTNSAGALLINGTGNTLTLGSGGITGYGSGNIYFKPKLNQSVNAAYNFGGKTVWFDGGLSGAGNIAKTGTGNMIVSGSNTAFSGNIDFGGGVLSVNNDNALGAGILTLSGGTLNAYTALRTLTNNIVLVGTASRFERYVCVE